MPEFHFHRRFRGGEDNVTISAKNHGRRHDANNRVKNKNTVRESVRNFGETDELFIKQHFALVLP